MPVFDCLDIYDQSTKTPFRVLETIHDGTAYQMLFQMEPVPDIRIGIHAALCAKTYWSQPPVDSQAGHLYRRRTLARVDRGFSSA